MLCCLLDLPPLQAHLERLNRLGILIRRPNPWEVTRLRDFVSEHFAVSWADEACLAFSQQPVSCFIAQQEDHWLGFAAYECTRRNFFGPTGVTLAARGQGLGTALLLAAMRGLRQMGYAYAIIGGVREPEYYEKTVGARVISQGPAGSIYRLRQDLDL
jgi:hypothetical protein